MTLKNLSNPIVTALSARAQDELYATLFYRALSGWCRDAGMANAATYFANEADDEQKHLQKLLDWCADWNVPITVPVPERCEPIVDFESALLKAYDMELNLGMAYNDLRRLIWTEDLFTYDFLAFFTDVQATSVIEYNDLLKQWEGSKALGIIWFDTNVMAG